jgi:Histidine kinase
MKINWLDKVQHFLQTLAFCLAISALQVAFQPQRPYEVPLLYSLCIGSFMWALIDFGRHAFPSAAETGWPQGIAALALPLGGIVGGYVLGTLTGDAVFGWSSWGSGALAQVRVSVLITAMAGIAATSYFYSKSKSAYLLTKVSEARHQASEAKLKLLEAQIEPHMLFNTLANLRALVTTDPAAALNMLDRMNDYLRATLKASRTTLHPLQTEFDRLRDYLELMAVRMGPRLRYTLDLPPELANEPVPTLLLQPLVENSIRHGLEPKLEGGSITVQARRTGHTITLDVIDTGVGLRADTGTGAAVSAGIGLHSGMAHGAQGLTAGFGLNQVCERLAKIYGNTDATLNIANYSTGTWANITFTSQNTLKSAKAGSGG